MIYDVRIVIALVGFAALLMTAIPSPAQNQTSGITVTGNAEMTVQPDIAIVTLGVTTEASEAEKAVQENARIANAVVDAIVKAGIAKRDIETSQYSVAPIMDYQKVPPVTTGYKVTNTVRLKVRNLTKVGSLIDTAIGAGANNVQGVGFDIEDPSFFRKEALVKALKKAEADAKLIADTLGVKLGKVVSVSETGPVIIRPTEYGVARAEATTTPIIPGQVRVTALVTVVYSIL
jgi:uncharacterized protein YggE